MNNSLVVVPTYNERENLPLLAQRLLRLPVPVDMLVVDNNSPDGTGKVADDLATKHPSIHVLHGAQKRGLGRAYIAAFKWWRTRAARSRRGRRAPATASPSRIFPQRGPGRIATAAFFPACRGEKRLDRPQPCAPSRP